jgi:hypothetical protein
VSEKKVPFVQWFSICTSLRNSKFQWFFVAIMNILVTSHQYLATAKVHASRAQNILLSTQITNSKYSYQSSKNTVAYSLKARTVESQQLAVTMQWPVNNNRGMVFSAQSMLMAVHITMEYIMPSLSNNCTAIEER